MEYDIDFSYAGDLILELEMIEELNLKEEQIENSFTHTQKCGTFLTIVCC